MTNRFNRWLPILLLIAGVPFWWYLIDTGRGEASPKPVHIAALRVLADVIPGPHPTALTYTLLATRSMPGDFLAAGIGLKQRALAAVAWTLPVPGRAPILIDPGVPPAARIGRFDRFDNRGLRRIKAQAMTALVLNTLGTPTLATGPRTETAATPTDRAGIITAAAAPVPQNEPAAFTTAQAVAPGVVVINAASHTPGARLIYVQLADGREFLFAGDIAALTENWTRLRARSRLADDLGPPQNRSETYAWLRTIRQLRIEAPKLGIVPGHDYNWLVKLRDRGEIAETRHAPATRPARPQAMR